MIKISNFAMVGYSVVSGNICTEINIRIPEIFPRGNFGNFLKISKNSFSPLNIDMEILNS